MKLGKYKKSFVIALLLIITWILSCGIIHKIGSFFYNRNNLQKAVSFYKISSTLIPFWKKPKKRLTQINKEINTSNNKRQIKDKRIHLDQDQISILRKEVIKTEKPFHNNNGYMLTALLKNNTEYGIPYVKIKKINLYNENKLVAVKDDPSKGDFFMVSKGEFPFYFYLLTKDFPELKVDNFELEISIPSFIPNENVVRLTSSIEKLVSLNIHQNKSTYYEYQVKISNPHNFPVERIYRTSILKYQNLPLNRLDTTDFVEITEKPNQNNEIINLNEKEQKVNLSLDPNESRTIKLKIMVEDTFKNHFQPKEVELTNYFTGIKKKT